MSIAQRTADDRLPREFEHELMNLLALVVGHADILVSQAVPVIFITAFPERLLTGERPEPTFLVTKPFNPEMVKALISQALFFDEGSRAAA